MATDGRDKIALVSLVSLLAAALFYGWRVGHLSKSAATALLLLLMLLEIGTESSTYAWHHKDQGESRLTQMAADADLLQFLRKAPGPLRMEVDSGSIPYNWGDWQGMEAFDCYLASLTTNLAHVQGDFRVRMLYGLKYWLGKKAIRPDQIDIFTARSGLKVYLNPSAFPRTWTVHSLVTIPSAEEAGTYFQQSLTDVGRQVILTGPAPHLETCSAPDQTWISRADATHVAIETNMGCGGMLILGDTWDPGWHVRVDGRSATSYAAYTFLRGVIVPAGRHRVEWHYLPASVVYGGLLTAIGMAGACWFAWHKANSREDSLHL